MVLAILLLWERQLLYPSGRAPLRPLYSLIYTEHWSRGEEGKIYQFNWRMGKNLSASTSLLCSSSNWDSRSLILCSSRLTTLPWSRWLWWTTFLSGSPNQSVGNRARNYFLTFRPPLIAWLSASSNFTWRSFTWSKTKLLIGLSKQWYFALSDFGINRVWTFCSLCWML